MSNISDPRAFNLVGRHQRVERAQRFCEHCLKLEEQHVEDEQHFALECPRYQDMRTRYCEKLALHTDMHTLLPQVISWCWLTSFANVWHCITMIKVRT
jgi:hypothetical protein